MFTSKTKAEFADELKARLEEIAALQGNAAKRAKALELKPTLLAKAGEVKDQADPDSDTKLKELLTQWQALCALPDDPTSSAAAAGNGGGGAKVVTGNGGFGGRDEDDDMDDEDEGGGGSTGTAAASASVAPPAPKTRRELLSDELQLLRDERTAARLVRFNASKEHRELLTSLQTDEKQQLADALAAYERQCQVIRDSFGTRRTAQETAYLDRLEHLHSIAVTAEQAVKAKHEEIAKFDEDAAAAVRAEQQKLLDAQKRREQLLDLDQEVHTAGTAGARDTQSGPFVVPPSQANLSMEPPRLPTSDVPARPPKKKFNGKY